MPRKKSEEKKPKRKRTTTKKKEEKKQEKVQMTEEPIRDSVTLGFSLQPRDYESIKVSYTHSRSIEPDESYEESVENLLNEAMNSLEKAAKKVLDVEDLKNETFNDLLDMEDEEDIDD